MILVNCRELAVKASSGELESAPWPTRLLIRMHASMCRHCGRYLAQLRLLAQAARVRDESSTDSERIKSLQKRLKDRLS